MKHTIKRLSCLLLFIMLLLISCKVEAYDEKEHSKILRNVFLGNDVKVSGNAMTSLELATAIVLDQYNGNCGEYLNKLSTMVTGIPTLQEIDLKHVSINQHRSYTHKGWDDSAYQDFEKEASHWSVRKQILLSTTQQLWTDDLVKAEALAKFSYYIHILGDYEERLENARNSLNLNNQSSLVSLWHDEADPAISSEAQQTAEFINKYGTLPDQYITYADAKKAGYNADRDTLRNNLKDILPGKIITRGLFGNNEGLLPDLRDEDYYECDIDYENDMRGTKRLVYTPNGVVYCTVDHYETFYLILPILYKTKNLVMDLGGRADSNDICSELLKILPVLFAGQENKAEYMDLSRTIKSINRKLQKLMGQQGGLNTNGKFLKVYCCAEDLLESLEKNCPKLVREISFMNEALNAA